MNTMDGYWSCRTLIRRDDYHGRLLELLDSYSPTTNTMDAYWSCWTPIRRDECHGRLL